MDEPLSMGAVLDEAGNAAEADLDKSLRAAPEPTPEPKEPAGSEPDQKPENKSEVQPDDWRNNDKVPEWLRKLDEKTLADLEKGQIIPKHRFDEVSGKSKLYESFGTPEELKAKLTQLAEAAVRRDDKAPKTDDLTGEDKEMRDFLLGKVAPELAQLPAVIQKMNEIAKQLNEQKTAFESQQKAAWDENVKNGENFVRKLATEAKLPIGNERTFKLILNGVLDILHENEAESDKFYYGRDTSVLKNAFEEFKKTMFSDAQRKAAADLLKDKENQDRLPKPPAKGGTGTTEKPEKPPESLEEAGDRSWEILQSAR